MRVARGTDVGGGEHRVQTLSRCLVVNAGRASRLAQATTGSHDASFGLIGYWTAPYFLWFHHTLYGTSVVVLNGPSCSSLDEQEQGNGDGGTFPQLWGVSRPPPHSV